MLGEPLRERVAEHRSGLGERSRIHTIVVAEERRPVAVGEHRVGHPARFLNGIAPGFHRLEKIDAGRGPPRVEGIGDHGDGSVASVAERLRPYAAHPFEGREAIGGDAAVEGVEERLRVGLALGA